VIMIVSGGAAPYRPRMAPQRFADAKLACLIEVPQAAERHRPQHGTRRIRLRSFGRLMPREGGRGRLACLRAAWRESTKDVNRRPNGTPPGSGLSD
jgi:hypothetical protein